MGFGVCFAGAAAPDFDSDFFGGFLSGMASGSPPYCLTRDLNSCSARKSRNLPGSGSRKARSDSGTSTGTSVFRVTSSRDMRASSAPSMRDWRRLGCLISSARARMSSSPPYSPTSCAAVLTPIPGTPGTLSVESPASACTSMTRSGPTPNFSITCSRPMRTFFMASNMVIRSSTSCMRSLSDETMVTSAPASAAWRA